ncbi:hypothetical protein AA23498_1812 [Acetobacter nitrogenifigens DSM 23921 = NBRC 105050]|uniref:Uncharacterized protein n=1 Tax=Acetobacter nitrogenifigens DSM 23921 = NBRC 105050 TaxID=1120919 RepID=A0A511X9Q9_9PROT|nr:VC0807 family protein [Acetobacter nitrogenifigens]GBQ93718.1 hypothetical protein AA23498_1812 [Acetobacter nitrogenifigens DSM 23921 = NBRC 105050]GEN59651.1 hypothetical protein ANI02nite_15350 [Acetobacter nitrogenifigens DSM 23921 = NBRC 105050]
MRRKGAGEGMRAEVQDKRSDSRPMARFRGRGFHVVADLAVNFALPLLIYNRAAPVYGDVTALLASAAPPILWSLAEFAIRRIVDAISMLVLAGIALSLLAMMGGGGARFLQLRENLVSALIGVMFLGSVAAGKPLVYYLARATMVRQADDSLERFEALRHNAGFRRVMTIMTLVWGCGLLVSASVACVLTFVLSIQAYLIVHHFLGYGTMGALGAWTFWYRRRVERSARFRGEGVTSATVHDAAIGS